MKTTKYVLGFAFNKGCTEVLLIEKKRPNWMVGKLNGVGGHIEDGETPIDAMVREFKEETNLFVSPWVRFAVFHHKITEHSEGLVVCYTVEGPIYEAKQTTNEPLIVAKVKELPSNILYNLSWLIPMAMGDTKVYNITEVE